MVQTDPPGRFDPLEQFPRSEADYGPQENRKEHQQDYHEQGNLLRGGPGGHHGDHDEKYQGAH